MYKLTHPLYLRLLVYRTKKSADETAKQDVEAVCGSVVGPCSSNAGNSNFQYVTR